MSLFTCQTGKNIEITVCYTDPHLAKLLHGYSATWNANLHNSPHEEMIYIKKLNVHDF